MLVCAALLTGCVTTSEFRQSPPARTAIANGNYLALADCVMKDIGRLQGDEGVWYQFLSMPGVKSASILGVVRVPAGLFYTVPAPVLELSFKQGEADQVAVEVRTRFPGSALAPRVWPIVDRCAGTKLSLVPRSIDHPTSE